MKLFDDRVVLVTGGGSGIGRAVVESFLEHGARVVVLEKSAQRVKELEREGGEALRVVQGDVVKSRDNRRAVQRALDEFGQLDVFIGNAGIWDGKRTLEELSWEEVHEGFDELVQVNVKGYMLGAKAALPALRTSGGCMVFTVSGSGFFAGRGGTLYTASKHAVVGLVKELAYELKPDVRVNGVSPGGTVSRISGPAALDMDEPLMEEMEDIGEKLRNNPLQVACEPRDHVGAYLLLASDKYARAMTGTFIHSDGGTEVRDMGP